MRFAIVTLAAAALAPAHAQDAPAPITRADAVDAAVLRGARLALARADTAVAYAQLLTARALPNPTLSAVYSKDAPNYHFTADWPFDYPGIRRTRIQAAQASC